MSSTLKVFTFPAAYGLPTTGPFGLKLEACLRLAGVDYERCYEINNNKGPKGKSPWIEHGNVRMGDTELILEHLSIDPDKDLSPAQRAQSHVIRRTFEEHFHAVMEHEMFVNDAGWAHTLRLFDGNVPSLLIPVISRVVRNGFRKHLYERGIGRHESAEIEAMGKADLDALSELLGEREWLVADHPSKVDAAVFGLLAIGIASGMPTPVASYARSLSNLVAFVERGKARFFPEFC